MVLAGCALLSCGHKDDNPKPLSQIIGTWNGNQYIELTYQGSQLVQSDTQAIVSPDFLTIEFKTDNSFSLSTSSQGDSLQESGVYSIHGNKLLLGETVDITGTDGYSFTINGSSMELVGKSSETNNNITDQVEDHIFLNKE